MKILISRLLGLLVPLNLAGCTFTVAEPMQYAPTHLASQAIAAPNPTPKPAAIAITRYKIDTQCNTLQPTTLTVPAEKSLDHTVTQIIGDRSNGDFRIAGYRLQVNPQTRIATLDLRLPTNATRNINSLSNCEQLALFGELRETLTKNAPWKIKGVQFQLQGKEIQF